MTSLMVRSAVSKSSAQGSLSSSFLILRRFVFWGRSKIARMKINKATPVRNVASKAYGISLSFGGEIISGRATAAWAVIGSIEPDAR